MKRFISRVSLFAILLFSVSLVLCEIEFSDEFIVKKTANTSYHKVLWNLDIINNHPEKIEGSVLFFGSSLVLNGINDSLLTQKGLKSYNFGINHSGNEINLYFLNRLQHLKPKAVVFLKRKTKREGLHKLTPLLFTPSKLLDAGQKPSLFFIQFLFKRLKLAVEFLTQFSDTEALQISAKKHTDFGIMSSDKEVGSDFFHSEATAQKIKQFDELISLNSNQYSFLAEKEHPQFLTPLKVKLRKLRVDYWEFFDLATNSGAQEKFIRAAQQICEHNNIPHSKLYIPVLSDTRKVKGYQRSYFQAAPTDNEVICLSDFSKFDHPQYWWDFSHLTYKGAALLAEELVQSDFAVKFDLNQQSKEEALAFRKPLPKLKNQEKESNINR